MSRLASRCAPPRAEEGQPWTGHRSRRGQAALPALTASVLVAICLVFAFVMTSWHRDVGRVLGSSGESVAAAVAGEVDRNVELLDFSLRGVAQQWGMPEVQALSSRLRDLVLFDNALRAPGFGLVMVLDRDGRLAADSDGRGGPGISFADRDYFRVHANTSDVGLYVSKPFRSRLSDHWTLALSRRIDDAAGGFAGVAVGTLDIAYLDKLYAGLGIGPGSTVTLFRTDGTVITREPHAEKDVRLFAGGEDSFNRMRVARDGTFEGPSPIDGLPRIIAFHRLGNLPMIQAVEVLGEGEYADWWCRAIVVAGLLVLLCFGVLGLSLALHRELGRRSAAEAELLRLAGTDALTGLANRRRFEAVLDDEWSRATKANEPLAVLMIDADMFKSYNDCFGHPAGDTVLQAIAGQLEAGARRRGGLACRYGGEEFVVLIPGCDEARASLVGEDLRAAVEALTLLHPSGIGGVVTISVGAVSGHPSGNRAARDLVAISDNALYRAKAAGRNQCHVTDFAELRAA